MNNRILIAGVVVIGLAAVSAVGWWLGSSEPGAEASTEVSSTTSSPDTPAPSPRPRGRITGTRMPDDVRDDLIRHRERLRRAVELGLGTPVPRPGAAEVDSDVDTDVEEVPEPFVADRAGIEAAIQEAVPQVYECIDGYGPEVGPFDGELALTFELGSNVDEEQGVDYPSEVSVAGVDVPTAVSACVTSVFSDLRFVPDSGATTVTYPLNLVFDDE